MSWTRIWPLCLIACAESTTQPSITDFGDAGIPDARERQLVLAGSWGGFGLGEGQFVEPSSVELDSEGFVYVAGHENRVQKFTPDGELVFIWGTAGTGDGQFNHPHGLAIDRARDDSIFVGDQENHRIQVFTTGGAFVRLWNDPQFKHIHDVGIDPVTGDIFIGDYELHVLQKFTATGDPLAELGGFGGEPGQFNGIWGVSTDSNRNVYVADTFNRRLQKLDRDGVYLKEWYGGGFQKPTGVFVDSNDVVYLCDSLAETIFLFSTEGLLIDRWYLPEIIGERTEPEDIVIDRSGVHVYIAEVRNHRVYHLMNR